MPLCRRQSGDAPATLFVQVSDLDQACDREAAAVARRMAAHPRAPAHFGRQVESARRQHCALAAFESQFDFLVAERHEPVLAHQVAGRRRAQNAIADRHTGQLEATIGTGLHLRRAELAVEPGEVLGAEHHRVGHGVAILVDDAAAQHVGRPEAHLHCVLRLLRRQGHDPQPSGQTWGARAEPD